MASGCEREVYFTHQRAVCNPGRRLGLSGNGPTVGHFYAFLPGISEIFAARGLIPAVLAGGGPLWARVGLIAPDDVAGLHWLPKILFDAALPCQRPAPGQQGPQAPPTRTVPGAGAALGSWASETKSHLLLSIKNNIGNKSIYTVGKVYEFKNGKLTANDGTAIPITHNIESFKEWEEFSNSDWAELHEELSVDMF